MSRPHFSLTSEQDDEETTVDRRFRDRAGSLCETELIDPADILAAKLPYGGKGSADACEDVDPESRKGVPPAGPAQPRFPILGGLEPKSLVIGIVLSALVCLLATLAYREHQNAQALRKSIEEISRAQPRAGPTNAPEHATDSGPVPIDRVSRPPVRRDTLHAVRVALERQGADLLVANDYLGALAHYRALAVRFPNEPVFADLVTVLESKQRCLGSGAASGETCR
jgi:hypothetical protein